MSGKIPVLGVTYSTEKLRAVLFEYDKAEHDRRPKTISFTKSIVAKMVPRSAEYFESHVDITKGGRANCSGLGKWLKNLSVMPKRTCVAGYGPVISLDKKSNNYAKLSSMADGPFSGFSVTRFVCKSVGAESSHEFSWISDCAALGLHEYWNTIDNNNRGRRLAILRIGRGVGGSLISNSDQIKGMMYTSSEVGHMPVHHEGKDDMRPTACPWHEDGCLTGHISRAAIEQRAADCGRTYDDLFKIDDEITWDIWLDVAAYIAQACVTIMTMWAPNQIVLSGSLIRRAEFLEPIVKYLANQKLLGFDAATLDFNWGNFLTKKDDDNAILAGAVHGAIVRSNW